MAVCAVRYDGGYRMGASAVLGVQQTGFQPPRGVAARYKERDVV